MKYDILHQFRDLLEQEQLAPNTRKQYYSFVKKVLGGLNWQQVEDINPAEVQEVVAKLKTSNDVSAARNGLQLFCKHYPLRLELQTGKELHKRNRAKRKWQPLHLDELKRKVNAVHDSGERLAYRVMLATGVRVSEVANLYPEDIEIIELTAEQSDATELMVFQLRQTKKGTADMVSTSDPYLLHQLTDYIADKPRGEPIFKACQTLKNRAGELGIECHDLRRVYAREQYAEACATLERTEALDTVRNKLRHENERTTRRYLRRKIV